MSQSSGIFIALGRAGDNSVVPAAAAGLSAPAWVEWLQHLSSEAAILLPLITLVWISMQVILKIVELLLRLRVGRPGDDDTPDLTDSHHHS